MVKSYTLREEVTKGSFFKIVARDKSRERSYIAAWDNFLPKGNQDRAHSISPGSSSFLRRFCPSTSRSNNFWFFHFRANKVTMHMCLLYIELEKKTFDYKTY